MSENLDSTNGILNFSSFIMTFNDIRYSHGDLCDTHFYDQPV